MFKHYGFKNKSDRVDLVTTMNINVNPCKFSYDNNDVLTKVFTGQLFSSAVINITAIRMLGFAVYTALHTATNSLMKEEN